METLTSLCDGSRPVSVFPSNLAYRLTGFALPCVVLAPGVNLNGCSADIRRAGSDQVFQVTAASLISLFATMANLPQNSVGVSPVDVSAIILKTPLEVAVELTLDATHWLSSRDIEVIGCSGSVVLDRYALGALTSLEIIVLDNLDSSALAHGSFGILASSDQVRNQLRESQELVGERAGEEVNFAPCFVQELD